MDLADVRAVFFDVDDTLYDFEASMAYAFEHLVGAFPDPLGRHGTERLAAAYHGHYRGMGEQARFELIHRDPDLFRRTMWAGALGALRLDEDEAAQVWLREHHPGVTRFDDVDGFARILSEEFVRVRPLHWRQAMYAGARDLLVALRPHKVLGAITNGPGPVQRPKLEALSYQEHFPEPLVFVSGEFGVRKPDPSIFLAAAKAAGVAPHECLMVGDSRTYDMPAKAVGFRTVLFHGPRERVDTSNDPYPPDAEVTSYAELHRLLV